MYYAGEWIEGFIKVKHQIDWENDIKGWVSSAYVDVPLLTSDILEPFEPMDTGAYYSYTTSCEGLLIENGCIKLNGRVVKLKVEYNDNFWRYFNQEIEMVHEYSQYSGVLFIRYRGMQEMILVNYEWFL